MVVKIKLGSTYSSIKTPYDPNSVILVITFAGFLKV